MLLCILVKFGELSENLKYNDEYDFLINAVAV